MYFAIYLIAFVPAIDFNYDWTPDNVMKITGWATEPAADLQAGDIVLAIDGQPVRWTIWSPLFPPRILSEHEPMVFSIQRDDQQLEVTVPAAARAFPFIQRRTPVVLTGLFVWVIGAIVILFATPQNRDAWQLGLTAMFVAIVVVATEAALYGVPGAWLSTPLLPFVAVMWIQIGFIPHADFVHAREKTLLCVLYIIAGLFSCVFLYELLFITPSGSGHSLESLLGVSSYAAALFFVMFGLLSHLLILGWRFVRLPASFKYQRQQIRIILAFAAVAYLPVILLTFLPEALFDVPLLPWLLAFPLLALGPAGYAFVIFRSNYLDLDIVTTQTLSSLLVALFLLSIFSALFYFAQPDIAVVMLGVMLLVFPRKKMRNFTDTVVYGENKSYDSTSITSNLSANPQLITLQKTVQDMSDLLNIRHIVLMLVDENQCLVPVVQTEATFVERPSIQEFTQEIDPNSPLIITSEATYPFLNESPWVNYIVPLVVSGDVVGTLLVGRPTPDGYLNAEQASFVRQIANVMAVTVEAIQRFDASRLMSRKLLADRYETRLSLANRIHNEPLHQISSLRNELLHVSKSPNDNHLFDQLTDWEQTLDCAATQLREICADLHPPVFDQGPKWAVREVVAGFREKFDLEIRLSITISNELKASRKITKTIYNILIEALNNVQKHADASIVWVSLQTQNPDELVLTVRDNGRVNSLKSFSLIDPIRNHHFGIAGMYEEADLVGGNLTVVCHQDGGVIVKLRAPLSKQRDDALIEQYVAEKS